MGGLHARAVTALVAALALLAVLAAGGPASAADPTPSSTPSATPESVTTTPTKGQKADAAAKAKAAAKAAARAKAAAKAAEEAKAAARAERMAKLAAEAAEDAAALAQATKELLKARADLAVARTALDTAKRELRAARIADAGAQSDLEAALLAEERATRELADVETRIRSRHTDLGLLARTAYQSSGAMGEWAIVLSSTTPNQLADRLAFLQSVGTTGNAVIADLEVDRADLLNAQHRLTAARQEATAKRAAAASALAVVGMKKQLAQAAELQVSAVMAARQAAYEDARRAAVVDRAQYQVLVVQSGALGSRIVDLSGGLASGGRPPAGTGRFARPGTGPVTSEYGPRMHPILRYVKVHTGTDFGAGDGLVYAADDGVVLFSEYNVAYGNMTVVDHGRIGGQRVSTLYAHQAAVGVRAGDRVVKGQAIGVIGSTGYSTGPHLHFEVRVDGVPLDPSPFLAGAGAPAGAGT